MQAGKKYPIGNFIVQPISVYHNVENYAYLIENDNIGRLFFVTDCVELPNHIERLNKNPINHLFIEANADKDIIFEHLYEGEDVKSRNEYHMDIKETIESIRKLYTASLNTICLLHLSDGQSDEESFKEQVYDEFGIMPYVADKGLTIELNKEEF